MQSLNYAWILVTIIAIGACSGSESGSPVPTGGANGAAGAPSGGSPASSGGQATGFGGSAAGGSQSGSGGAGTGGINAPTGGTPSVSSSMPTGGEASAGGSPSTGGSLNTGGAKATGGVSTTAGAASMGGGVSTGGSKATGGAPLTGGATSTGGSKSTGGASPTGGLASTGGSKATGGASSTGGSSSSSAAYMPNYIIGADITGALQQEDGGMKFRDTDGTQPTGTISTGGGLLTVLKNHKFNYIRIKTFVNPSASGGYATNMSQAYGDRDHAAKLGAGVKLAGMGILLDFHYSDTWADPGTQTKPAAWAGLSFAALTTQVYNYTKDVITVMKAANARPDIVQIGNEIPQGLLFDATGITAGTGGKVSGTAFGNLATLLKAGIQAVKDVDSNIKIMMHLDRCHDLAVNTWWVSGVQGQGVSFDILGESCYDYSGYQQPSSSWSTTFSSLASSYPSLQFTATEYQPNPLLVNQVVAGIVNKRGLGSFIYEPTTYNDMGTMLFTIASNVATAKTSIADFDTIYSLYGSR